MKHAGRSLRCSWLWPSSCGGCCLPAAAADAVFPIASRLGPRAAARAEARHELPGFEDDQNDVFVRLIALPGQAFAEIEKTMTNEALKKQGMTVEKRETLTLAEAATPSW